MKGDFSRFTFDAKKRFTGVRMQQGRVQLDADWNEQIDLQLERERREMRDIIGYAGGPRDNLGFKISGSGNKLKVGKGHYYVAGRLCWNENVFEIDNPEPLLEKATYLAYLDVWERHVTWLEDADIRETALGGPDTTTRTQLVSQVKLISVDGGVDCSAYADDDWVPDQLKSTGKMAVQSKPIPNPPGDICAPTPQSGYSGLENQLYRVEVQEILADDTIIFKWSRENGCVATRWTAKNGNKLIVMSTGLDEKLCFKADDLVELTDSAREQEASNGILAVLESVSDKTFAFNDTMNLGENGSVRRWEGQLSPQFTEANGTKSPWITLEDGIEIAFEKGIYQPGDYWTIPARAFLGKGQSEGQGDILWPKKEDGQPLYQLRQGPDHFYAPLALCQYTEGKWLITSYCQQEFSPLSEISTKGDSCCITVRPGEDIQKAVDSLPIEGGCICLKSGIYVINQPIVLKRSNLVFRGESPGVRILRKSGHSILEIRESTGVKVEGVQLEFAPGADFAVDSNEFQAVVSLYNCQDAELIRSNVILSPVSPIVLTYPLCGVLIENGKNVQIADNTVSSFPYGVVVHRGDLSTLSAEGNSIYAPEIGDEEKRLFVGNVGIWVITSMSRHQILHNLILGYQQGIALWEANGVTVAGNRIHRYDTVFVKETELTYAIIIWKRTAGCAIIENFISLSSPLQGGIRVAGAEARIEKNTIQSEVSAELKDAGAPVGIFVAPSDNVPLDKTFIKENRLTGFQIAVSVRKTLDAKVHQNHMDLSGTESRGILSEDLNRAVISENMVHGAEVGMTTKRGGSNVLTGNRIFGGGVGIYAEEEAYLKIMDNEAANMQWAGLIAHSLLYTAAISRCRFSRCGYESPPEPFPNVGVGIGIGYCFAEVVIEHCQILDIGLPAQGQPSTTEVYGIHIELVVSCRLQGNLVGYTQTTFDEEYRRREDCALFLGGMVSSENQDAFGSALVSDNKFIGPGKTGLVKFNRGFRFENVNFSGNQCVHYNSAPDGKSATINFNGEHIIVMGNHVKAKESFHAMNFGELKHVVLMGNITTGDYLPTPFNHSKPQPPANYNLKL